MITKTYSDEWFEIMFNKKPTFTSRENRNFDKTFYDNGNNNDTRIPLKSTGKINNGARTLLNSVKQNKKQKIFLIADSNGRNCFKILEKLDKMNKYQITNNFKPNAVFENVVDNINNNSTKAYTKDDHVIIFAGTNNALNRKLINLEKIQETLKYLQNTNVILVAIPYLINNVKFNKYAYKNNRLLYNQSRASENNNVCFVDSNLLLHNYHFTQHGLHLNNGGKRVLFNSVMKKFREKSIMLRY